MNNTSIFMILDYFGGTSNCAVFSSFDGNLHGSGMSRATIACLEPTFRAPWRVGDAVVRQRKCWMDNIKEWTSLPMLELLNEKKKKNGRGSQLDRPP